MHTEGVAHGPATLFLHTGATNLVRPSVGSWITYGLGTENQNLPGFMVLNPSLANGGPRNYGSAFLPAIIRERPSAGLGCRPKISEFEICRTASDRPKNNSRPQFDLVQAINREQLKSRSGESELEAVIDSYELAFRMQQHAPTPLIFSSESRQTLNLYGIDEPKTDNFGRQCLMARRLAERRCPLYSGELHRQFE